MTKEYKSVPRETPPLDDLGTMPKINVKKFGSNSIYLHLRLVVNNDADWIIYRSSED